MTISKRREGGSVSGREVTSNECEIGSREKGRGWKRWGEGE